MTRGTWAVERRLLVVVRNPTSLFRLLQMLDGMFSGCRVSIKFTIDLGSRYSRDLREHLQSAGCDELGWDEATGIRFDAIIAAHPSERLSELRGPLLLIAHGAGYPRLVPETTAGEYSPTGVARSQLTRDGRVIPAKIGLSHEEQFSLLERTCPEALDRAVVIGDPTMDQLRFSVTQREQYRKKLGLRPEHDLVLVTSTWGDQSALGVDPVLPHRLLAQLPMGRFRIALVQHWNISQGHSRFEVAQQFRDAQDCGLIVVPPDASWQAALIAADIVLGDHGSVTVYGVALGKPLLLVSDGGGEVDPQSPNTDLWAVAQRLDPHSDLRHQVESALGDQDVEPMRKITERVFGLPGRSWKTVQNMLREMMGLPLASFRRVRPIPPYEPAPGEESSSFLVSAELDVDGKRIALERFPDVPGGFRSPPDENTFLVVNESEVDMDIRCNAEIVLCGRVVDYWSAHERVRVELEEHPGAALACAATENGCVVAVRGHPPWEVHDVEPLVAASAAYCWIVGRQKLEPDLRLVVDENGVTTVVVLSVPQLREAPQPRVPSQLRTSALRGLPAAT